MRNNRLIREKMGTLGYKDSYFSHSPNGSESSLSLSVTPPAQSCIIVEQNTNHNHATIRYSPIYMLETIDVYTKKINYKV